MNLPLDVMMIIAVMGGPILQYKLSICSSSLYQRMQRLWSPIRKRQFIAKKFPASNWHLDTCDGEVFKTAHPSITAHLLEFLDLEVLSGDISIRDQSEKHVELRENISQQCLASRLHKTDLFTSIDSKYGRVLQFDGMGGNSWSFWIYRDESHMCVLYNISRRVVQSTLYKFSPVYLLDFETYDFFDCKNTILHDIVLQVNRYHLVIRFDSLNRWIKAHVTYSGEIDWETLSPEEQMKHRHWHYEKNLKRALNELIEECKLDSRHIQVDRERNEIHVTFEL